MQIEYHPMAADAVDRLRHAGRDAHDMVPERRTAEGHEPCRACLRPVRAGATYLIAAHRPFAGLNPYTETGPIFVCERCETAPPMATLPPILTAPHHLVRAYDTAERIRYGTGRVTETGQIATYAATLLQDADTAFVDVRSASNNCWLVRVHRA